jgi:hypothetical protein
MSPLHICRNCLTRLLRSQRSTAITTQVFAGQQRRRYQNATLTWARENREVAQACLDLPPLDNAQSSSTSNVTTTTTTTTNTLPTSWEAYLQDRQWIFPAQANVQHATALVSHVLSTPLTMATQLRHLVHQKRTQRWCCLGARSEASIPVDYWKEMLRIVARNQPKPVSLTLDFIGPEVLRRPTVNLQYHSASSSAKSTLTLQWLYNGTFHEYMERTTTSSIDQLGDDMIVVDNPHVWDAYILCNPGLGHPHLHDSWQPTLQFLLQEQNGISAPLLLTAHSTLDAQRDTNTLANYVLPEAPLYVRNPFGSHIDYQDPLIQEPEHPHFVQPNQYVYLLQWQ